MSGVYRAMKPLSWLAALGGIPTAYQIVLAGPMMAHLLEAIVRTCAANRLRL